MNWDSDITFWSANPQCKALFQEVYKRDTSKDKKKSSAYMWGLAYLFHITSSIFDWRFSDKLDYVRNFIWKDYWGEFSRVYKEDGELMSRLDGGDNPGMRQLKEWSRIMDEKSQFLSNQTYSKDTWQMLEDMLSSNARLFKEYERILAIVNAETSDTEKTVGQSKESLLEEKAI